MKASLLLLAFALGAPASASDADEAVAAGLIAAAKDQAARRAQAEAVAPPRRGYLVPPVNSPRAEEFRGLIRALANRRSDVGGGPEHIGALIGEPCAAAPSGCVLLIEPLYDWIVDEGDAASPYVYAMLDRVLSTVGERYHSLAAVGEAARAGVLLAGSPPYAGRGAGFAAADSLRRMLDSPAALKFDQEDVHIYAEAKGRSVRLTQLGADIAGLFDDAPAAGLSPRLRALIASQDPGTAIAALKSLGRLERTLATLDLISGLIVDKSSRLPRHDVAESVQLEALNQSATIAWQLWHQTWAEAARPYRDAIKALEQDALDDGRKAFASAADASFKMFPKPPEQPQIVR